MITKNHSSLQLSQMSTWHSAHLEMQKKFILDNYMISKFDIQRGVLNYSPNSVGSSGLGIIKKGG